MSYQNNILAEFITDALKDIMRGNKVLTVSEVIGDNGRVKKIYKIEADER